VMVPGKDPTKDTSAAYICRQMANSVVKSGLSKRCLVQLSYSIGVAKLLSLFVETYGTEQGSLTADDITNVLKVEFDCRPGAITIRAGPAASHFMPILCSWVSSRLCDELPRADAWFL